ncbi:hypothetical protein CTAYLR_010332 [Chrysophaeum taylorii]|uniref:Centrosomal protein CEP104 N-terminal domain-containing protein n=1 Tax=Chrysophaeum taylorii TaxID=2483200 RepID=A0AAD7UK35_9STRA|nr:hypothetical protein CTAYLR_010332 [Chrysophaeum taylorii]
MSVGFRVVSSSGCEASYPASELNRHSPQTRGWQSPKFCDYPQEVVLELADEVDIREVQILSHESKIATRVELYVDDRRLGYLSLDANERSGYRARELKSVYVRARGRYLRLVAHKCHVNRENLFNQVGIVAVNVIGEACEAEEDPLAAAQLAKLEAAKRRAVQVEDYDRAKLIKAEIERLRAPPSPPTTGSVVEPPPEEEEEEEEEIPQQQQQEAEEEAPSLEERREALSGVETQTELPEPEPLSQEASEIVSAIGEYRTRCLLSKNWLLRDAAIAKLGLMIRSGEIRDVETVTGIAKVGIDDKIPQVSLSSMGLAVAAARAQPSQRLEPLVRVLVAKLADNQPRARDKALESLEELAAGPVGASSLASVLVVLDKRHLINHKWRPIAARLRLLRKLVPEGIALEPIFNFVRVHDCASHTAAVVRNETRDLIAEISKRIDDDTPLVAVFDALRPKQREEYLQAIGRPLAIKPPHRKPPKPPPSSSSSSSAQIPPSSSSSSSRRAAEEEEEEIKNEGGKAAVVVVAARDDADAFRDLIMKQLEDQAFSIDEAYSILKAHFEKKQNDDDDDEDDVRDAVLKEWCAEIGSTEPTIDEDRDHLLKQVATWLFQ